MSQLTVHEALRGQPLKEEDILQPASRDGDEVTGDARVLGLLLVNTLKRRYRIVRMSTPDGVQTAIMVPPRQTRIIGPIGQTAGEMVLRLTYPANRGLRVAALGFTSAGMP